MFNTKKSFSFLIFAFFSTVIMSVTGCSDQEFVVSVDSPLRVLSITPSDGSGGVVPDTEIKAVFSEDVVELTLNPDSFFVNNITDPENIKKVAGKTSYESKSHTAKFTPAFPLSFSSKYQIVLTKDIEKKNTSNSLGGNLAIETRSVFSTIDPDNLAVVYTDPGTGAWDVPIRKDIKIVFSHPVKTDTVEIGSSLIVEDITDSENMFGIEADKENGLVFSEDLKTVTFKPADIYGYSRQIKVTLTSQIATSEATENSGFLKENIVVLFGTIDPPALGVQSVMSGSGLSPMKHEISDAPDTLVITFTEGVMRSSASLRENIIIEDVTGLDDPMNDEANGTIEGTLTWNADDAPDPETVIGSDNIATFTPDSLLLYGTRIRITLVGEPAPSMDGIISDRATNRGGQIEETKIYLFDVELIPDLVVTGITPGNISKHVPINSPVTVTFSEGIDCKTLTVSAGNPTAQLIFTGTDPLDPDGTIASSIKPVCVDGATEIIFVPSTDIKYSRDVSLVLSNKIASLRARNINDHQDPLQGHLREGYEAVYSTIDPPPLGVVNVGTESGSFLMQPEDRIMIGFSEGVAQNTVIPGTSIIIEDVTGLADPMNGDANNIINGTFSFNGADSPDPVTLIGSDNVVTFMPSSKFPYGTKIRVTIPGAQNPVSGIITSDRATIRGGFKTEDTVFLVEVTRLEELRVINTVPAHDNRNVSSLTGQIRVTFSAPPDCATVNDTNISVKHDYGIFELDPVAPNTDISGNWECNNGDNTVVFNADSPFGYGRDILIILSSNIRDARAADVSIYDPTQGYLVPEYLFGFGTEHLPNVQVIATNAAGSISYKRDLPIEVVFSHEINCSKINNGTVYIYRNDSPDPVNDKLAATLTCVNPESDIVIITAIDDTEDESCDGTALCYDTYYTVVIKGGYDGVCVAGKLNGDLSDDGCVKSPQYSFGFKTEITPALSVIIEPYHNADGVSVMVHPICKFSKPINTATVENEPVDPKPGFPPADGVLPNICLVKGYNQNDCESPDVVALDPLMPYTYTEGDMHITINPAAALDPEEWYTVVVSRDIEDTTGTRMTSFSTASFRTATGGLLNRVYIDGTTLDTLEIVAEFNQDVDVSTLNEASFYLSFTNEFGGTTLVPGTVTLSNWNGSGICDPLTENEHCNMATLKPDFMKLFSCGDSSGDPQYELPMNTTFKAHLSTFIKNSEWETDPLNVANSTGSPEYIYTFKTPVSSIIQSATYSSPYTGTTSLGWANEVPVNASFNINFKEEISPVTVNSNTIEIEDGRGDDGITTAASTLFAVAAPGTFRASDIGKSIIILTGPDAGEYAVTSFVSHQSVNIDAPLSANATGVSWSKIVDGSGFNFTLSSGGKAVTVKPDKHLQFHSNYRENNASVTGSTVTITTTLNNFKVSTERDLGRMITISGSSNAGNNITARIISVNEGTNSFGIDKTFAAAGSNLSWKIFSETDYHILRIKGRSRNNPSNYLKDIYGNPVPGTLSVRFTTSPETQIAFNPDGIIGPLVSHTAMALASRPLALSSVGENSLYYLVSNEKYYTLPTMYSHDHRIVLMTPVPSYLAGSLPIHLVATSGVLDFRGNPVKEKTAYLGTSGGAPSSNARTPSAGAVAPANLAVIQGDQRFTITWGTSNNNLELMNAGSINSETFDLVQIISTGTGGSTTAGSNIFTVSGTPFALVYAGYHIEFAGKRYKIVSVINDNSLQLDHTFTSGSSGLAWTVVKKYEVLSNYYSNAPSNGDIAEITTVDKGRDSRFLPAGANMRLTVYFTKIASLYNIGANTDVVRNYTVETVPPTISSAGIRAVSQSLGLTEANGKNDIASNSSIELIFSENIHPDTVNGTTVILRDKNGIFVDCEYSVNNNIVTLRPYHSLRSNLNNYTVSVTTEVTDVAGNALASPISVSFGVEITNPAIVSSTPADLTTEWSVFEPLRILFSEALDTPTVASGISVTYDMPPECNSGEIGIFEGCVAIDRTERLVTFAPYMGQFIDETEYSLNIDETITDKAGNTLDGGTHTVAFDTIGGDEGPAMPLCSDIPVTTTDDTVDVYFSEPIDPLSLIAGTVVVYHVETGEEIPGTVSLEAGNTVIRFTADSPFTVGETYGIIITSEIYGEDGLMIGNSYRAFFTIS